MHRPVPAPLSPANAILKNRSLPVFERHVPVARIGAEAPRVRDSSCNCEHLEGLNGSRLPTSAWVEIEGFKSGVSMVNNKCGVRSLEFPFART
jgi:hypothetical protein